MDRIPEPQELQVATLGTAKRSSPIRMSTVKGDGKANYVTDDSRILYDIITDGKTPLRPDISFERAGPRESIYFEPKKTRAAIVTCGGLCPGINNVIRSIYYELCSNYGVSEVLGIRFGYSGLNPDEGRAPVKVTNAMVDHAYNRGGTFLGSSRGPQSAETVIDFLQDQEIDILFCVGGDGTQRGAHLFAAEIKKRGANISIIGVPKTIDNDIRYVWRTFGFATAVSEAEKVINCAHVEAKSIANGVGLVKLMGREAGYIAAAASLASGQVDFALIPEIPFQLHGEKGLLAGLQRRLEKREHAVVVVAEGAGQDLLRESKGRHDASGNKRLGDIGLFLKEEILKSSVCASVKYFDPSYYIRSVPANATDSVLCDQFARHAVHAAMSGKTDMLIGYWHNQFVHVPLAVTTGATKRLSPEGDLWAAVLATTRQDRW